MILIKRKSIKFVWRLGLGKVLNISVPKFPEFKMVDVDVSLSKLSFVVITELW